MIPLHVPMCIVYLRGLLHIVGGDVARDGLLCVHPCLKCVGVFRRLVLVVFAHMQFALDVILHAFIKCGKAFGGRGGEYGTEAEQSGNAAIGGTPHSSCGKGGADYGRSQDTEQAEGHAGCYGARRDGSLSGCEARPDCRLCAVGVEQWFFLDIPFRFRITTIKP